jgi:transcriptional regulator with XRE-family HTH domain
MVNTTGDVIRRSLTRLKRTQSWLAEQMSVSDAAVAKWISTGEISRDKLVPLSRLLGISVDEVLTGEPALGTEISRVLEALPPEDGQMALDFISYRWERAEGLVATEKFADYTAMIERIKADMARRRAQ